jgi:hypothetical protein
MIALKPVLLFALLAGTSSAFAITQPQNTIARLSKTARTALSMSEGADAPPPELKVRED